jgi:hypothetical protein
MFITDIPRTLLSLQLLIWVAAFFYHKHGRYEVYIIFIKCGGMGIALKLWQDLKFG